MDIRKTGDVELEEVEELGELIDRLFDNDVDTQELNRALASFGPHEAAG